MVEAKPKFRQGDVLNGSVVIDFVGRVPHSGRKGRMVNNYKLRCNCGAIFTRIQTSLVAAQSRDCQVTCGCRGFDEDKYRAAPIDYNPAVPCYHKWGYDPRAA